MKPFNTYHVSCEGQIQVVKAHSLTWDCANLNGLELNIEDEEGNEITVAFFPKFSWIIKQPEGTEP